MSSSLLLTAGLSEGSKTRVSPLSAAKPPLRDAKQAQSINLKEIPEKETETSKNSSVKSTDFLKGKRRDWLTLLVREALGLSSIILSEDRTQGCLVDIRYISPVQKLEVVYEGKRRRFTVASAKNEESSRNKDLDEDLQRLSLDPTTQLWIVDWETQVVIEEDGSDSRLPAGKVK